MGKGSRIILIVSVAIAIGVTFVPLVVGYRSCEAEMQGYTDDQQDWTLVLNHQKTLSQVSTRALMRAHEDSNFREGRWSPPKCSPSANLLNFALAGIGALVVVFVGAHLAWLACRAFNKTMERLK